jgi:hypothetical protein
LPGKGRSLKATTESYENVGKGFVQLLKESKISWDNCADIETGAPM